MALFVWSHKKRQWPSNSRLAVSNFQNAVNFILGHGLNFLRLNKRHSERLHSEIQPLTHLYTILWEKRYVPLSYASILRSKWLISCSLIFLDYNEILSFHIIEARRTYGTEPFLIGHYREYLTLGDWWLHNLSFNWKGDMFYQMFSRNSRDRRHRNTQLMLIISVLHTLLTCP